MTTLAADPSVAAIAAALYGNSVDVEEFAKSIDGADVHIDGPVMRSRRRRKRLLVPVEFSVNGVQKSLGDEKDQRRLAAVGLGSTGVAMLAAGHAIKATKVENAERAARAIGEMPKPKPAWLAPKILRGVEPAKAAAVIGGAALALHGVELVGDTLGARAQLKELKKPPAKASADPLAKADYFDPMTGKRTSPDIPASGVMPGALPNFDTKTGVKIPKAAAASTDDPPAFKPPKTKAPVVKGLRISLKPVNPRSMRRLPSLRARRPAGSPMVKGLGTVKPVTPVGAASAAATYKPPSAGTTSALKTLEPPAPASPAPPPVMKPPKTSPVAKSFEAELEISKVDTDKHQVFGWLSVSVKDGKTVRDRQDDEFEIEDLEKTAYTYVLSSRVGGDQHARVDEFGREIVKFEGQPKHTSDMIESMVFTPEKIEKMGLPADFPQGWWGGFLVKDENTWQDIKKGKRRGFSIHGSGRREPILDGD